MKIKSFRLKCFIKHLLISSTIAIISAFIVFYIWYPYPLNIAFNVGFIFIILLALDVTIGPFLTLLVAKKGKKSLKFDLSIIALLQIGSLIYGLSVVSQGRPVWLAFDFNRFAAVQAYAVERLDNEAINQEYKNDSYFGPKWVSARPAIDREEQNEWLFYELGTGISPAMRPVLYAPLKDNIDRIINEGIEISELYNFNKEEDVNNILKKYPNANYFLPLLASEVDMTVLIDSKDKQIIKIVNLRPW